MTEEQIDLMIQLLESKIETSDDPEEIERCKELIEQLSK